MQLVPFESAQLPAALAKAFAVSFDDFSSGQRAGFPVISIKGKVFHLKRGDEKALIGRPDDPSEPASSIEVVVLKTHPGVAKTFYVKGFTEDSVEKPDCYSNDGIAPAADAQNAQAKKCALCPHNQWGSKITEEGKKAKACADVKRLAVATASQINDPMLIRVPAASLKAWDQFIDVLKKRGVPPPAVVTKIGFDHNVAYPSLTFKPVGFVPAEMIGEINETIASDVVSSIIGGDPTPPEDTSEGADGGFQQPIPERTVEPDKAPEKPKATPKPKAAAAVAAEVAEEPVREAVKVEAEKPAPTISDEVADELDNMLAGLGFDDDEAA